MPRNSAVALLVILITFATVTAARADFTGDFQAARGLFNQKNYPEAQAAFTKLADGAPLARGRALCLSLAAIALGYREGAYERALELAGTIALITPDGQAVKPFKTLADLTRMEIMAANGKHGEIIAAFRDEALAAWPDYINYRACFLRADAFARAGEREAAAADFEQCAALAGSDHRVKLEALNRFAGLRRALGDDAAALAACRLALGLFESYPDLKGGYLFPQTILGAAAILRDQGKHDEAMAALAMMGDPDGENRVGDWWFQVIESLGDSHLARGEKDRALARYRQAAAIKTHDTYLQRVNGKIEKLSANQ